MRLITILFFFLVLAIIVGANTGHLPGFAQAINDLPYGDKVGHFLLMGMLSFLVNASAQITFPARKQGRVVFITTIALLFLITLEEASQYYFPRRTMSLLDLVSDILGVGLAAWLAYRWGRSKAAPRTVEN